MFSFARMYHAFLESFRNDSRTRERVYVLLLASIQFIHIVDFVVMMPLGPYLMESMNVMPDQFAELVSSYNFSAAAAGFLFATVADRFDRKKLLLLTLFGFIVGTLFCSLSQSYLQLLSSRILTGCFGGTLNAVVFAMVTDLVPYKRRGKAMGLIMSAFSVASIVGIPIGLGVADVWGWESTFLYIVGVGMLIFALSFKVFPSLREHIRDVNPLESLKHYGKIISTPRYMFSHLFMFLVASSMFLLIPFLSPYAVKNIGIAKEELKYMYLVGGVFTVMSARLFGVWTDLWGALKMFWVITIFAIIPVLIYTHAGLMSLLAFIAMSALFMVLVSGRMIPCMTLLSSVPEAKDRGGFMGLLNSIRALGSASSTLIAGKLIVEDSAGNLQNFDLVGYISVGLIFVTLGMSLIVARFSAESEVVTPQNA